MHKMQHDFSNIDPSCLNDNNLDILEFSHYNNVATSALILVLNNDCDNSINLLQSHLEHSLVISATHVYVSMLKFFLQASTVNTQDLLKQANLVIERCKSEKKDLLKSLGTDECDKTATTMQLLLNDTISSQITICHSIISFTNTTNLLSSAFRLKQAIALHKKLYQELILYVQQSYQQEDNKHNNGDEKDGDGDNEDGNYENNNDNNDNEIKEQSKKNKFMGFLDDLLKPLNKRIFPETGFNSLAKKDLTKSYNTDDDDDEDDDEEDEAGHGRLENVYGFLNFGVLKKLSPSYDLFNDSEVEDGKEMSEKLHYINGYSIINHSKTNTFNKSHFTKLLGLVSFGHGLSLCCLLMLPRHPLLTTAVSFLGLTCPLNGQYEALEVMAVSALSASFVAPISCCVLLHLLCIHRNYFNISENNFAPERNSRLIERVLLEFDKYGRESVFKYYFRGKLFIIKGKIREALRVVKGGMMEANLDEQVKGLCEYDLCRIYIMKFDWNKSSKSLDRLLENLVVPHPYYSYLLAITSGARGRVDVARWRVLAEVVKRNKYRREFFTDRIDAVVKDMEELKSKDHFFKLLCYEVLYMWNAFRVLKIQQLDTVVGVCQKNLDGPLHSLASLITGVCLGSLVERKVKQSLLSSERFQGIESWFLQALGSHSHPCSEDHVLAMSCYELAVIKQREFDFEGATEYYRRAKLFDRKEVVFKWNMMEEVRTKMAIEKEEWIRGRDYKDNLQVKSLSHNGSLNNSKQQDNNTKEKENNSQISDETSNKAPLNGLHDKTPNHQNQKESCKLQ